MARAEIPANHEPATLFARLHNEGDENLSRTEFEEYASEDEVEAE